MPLDLNKHKEAYLKEAKSYVKNMNHALVELEKNPTNKELFHTIFQSVHTLKGLAATMRYEQTISICHAVEDLLDAIKNKKIKLKKTTDLLFKSLDFLSMNIKKVEANEEEPDASELIQQLKSILNIQFPLPKVTENNSEIQPNVIEKLNAIEVRVDRLDTLMNLAEELLVCKMKFDTLRSQIDLPEFNPAVESLGRLITELQYHVMQVRLVPVDFIFNRFFRMARDVAKQQGKEVDLQIEGGDIELDRLLIDSISEAIAHLIKNAIDHGLETPLVREQMNKPTRGTVKLCASRSKEAAIIEVSDDGAGLDLVTIKQIAIKQNILKPDASQEEVKNVIFSNLSTKSKVTEISGRGMGLAIVKQKIESLGGSIKLETHKNKGTRFFIEIPLTLAIVKMLFVKAAAETFALPIENVERLLIADPEDFKGLLTDEAIIFEGRDIPIVNLSTLFGGQSSSLQEKQPIVIVHKGSKRLGLAVNELLSTQEVVIKPLSSALKENSFFSGAAMIGSGEMVLIIDVHSILQLKSLSPVA